MRLAFTVLLSGVALGGVLVYGRFGVQRPGGNPMNDSRFMVDHVRLETDKPFEEVTKAFERQLGRFDPDVYQPSPPAETPRESGPRSRRWRVRAASCC